MDMTFGGHESESCEPLAQYVPLVPQRIPAAVPSPDRPHSPRFGLAVAGYGHCDGHEISTDAPDLSSNEEAEGIVRFAAMGRLARLAAPYQWGQGSTGIERRLVLRAVRLEPDQ